MRHEMHKSKLISPEKTLQRTASLIWPLSVEVNETHPSEKVRRKYVHRLVAFSSSYEHGKRGNEFSWG